MYCDSNNSAAAAAPRALESERTGVDSRREFQSRFYHLLAVGSHLSHLTSLSFYFHILEVGKTVVPVPVVVWILNEIGYLEVPGTK